MWKSLRAFELVSISSMRPSLSLSGVRIFPLHQTFLNRDLQGYCGRPMGFACAVGVGFGPPEVLLEHLEGAFRPGKVRIPALIGDLRERVPPLDAPPSEGLASGRPQSCGRPMGFACAEGAGFGPPEARQGLRPTGVIPFQSVQFEWNEKRVVGRSSSNGGNPTIRLLTPKSGGNSWRFFGRRK